MAVLARRRLEPDLLLHRGRHDWVPARELVCFGNGQRPYAKYVGDGNRRIHGIFTDGHPEDFKNSLHYAALRGRDALRHGRAQARHLDDVPLHTSQLDHIYNYSDRGGRAWGHDIALTAEGRPRIVYTRRVAGRDTFYYAYHNGKRWISRKIVEAGAGRPSFHSGGATLDHEDPRFVYLSRTIGRWNQVEQWFTPDDGRSWTHRQLTDDPDGLHHPPRHAARPERPPTASSTSGATSARSASPTTRPASTRWTSRPPVRRSSGRAPGAARARRARSPCGATRRRGTGRR